MQDDRLAERDFVAGSGSGRYSVTDIGLWTMVNAAAVANVELETYPNVYKWWKRISERPAVKRGVQVPSGKEFRIGYGTVLQMRKGLGEENLSVQEALRKILQSTKANE